MKELLYHLFGGLYSHLAVSYRQALTYSYSILHPYHYDAKRYSGTFLTTSDTENGSKLVKHVDRLIYIFWTGDNEITPNRLEGIKSLEKVCGVEVKLVTPKNLSKYIKEDDPLPEAYQYLSYVHRADYLRTYFMYHYGGGYADIKPATASWKDAFSLLEKSNAYAIGYPEVGFWGVASRGITNEHLRNDLLRYWRLLIGNCAYICRPYTPFVSEWYEETKRRVISYTDQLRIHPAQDSFGTNSDYPIPWEGILGEVFHPLCLKYHEKLIKNKALLPVFNNYR